MEVLVNPATLQKHEDRKRHEKNNSSKKGTPNIGCMGQDLVIYLGIWETCASNSNVDWSKVVIKLSQRSEINILRLLPQLLIQLYGKHPLDWSWSLRQPQEQLDWCKPGIRGRLQESGPCVDQVCPRLPISMKETLLTGLCEVDMQIQHCQRDLGTSWNCSNLQALNIAVWTLWTRDSKQREICNTRFLVQC